MDGVLMKNQGDTRRDFLKTAALATAAFGVPNLNGCTHSTDSGRPPNFIVIFCDDLGYGDLGCYGSQVHRTPNVDRMATEGTRLTSFYSASGVCTPSRASLLTSCYPLRVNMHQDEIGRCVLLPVSQTGLNPDKITIADILKQRGYATACIGKWHLGDQPPFLPTRQGFDFYFGIPYGNDMGAEEGTNRPPLPLMRNEEVIEAPVGQDDLTLRYTEEAVRFITESRDRPFLLYLPHSMVHLPVHASARFRGKSDNGTYGDAVEEIDWSTGEILATLEKLGIDDRTMVIFTSDNGAQVGSNAPLRSRKGTTWEGGQRVPCVVRWPGQISPGLTCNETTSTMDLLPTFARLAGTAEPADRVIDGHDIWPLLSAAEGAKTPYTAFYYYQIDQLQAVRSGKWKLHLPLAEKKRNWREPFKDVPLQLYDLEAEVSESTDVSTDHPKVVDRLLALAERACEDIGDVGREGKNQRPAGFVDNPKPVSL